MTADRPTILIVDDSPDQTAMLADAMAIQDFRATTVNSGRDAVRVSGQTPPDLIIMDAVMPGMNGFQTCEIMKSDPRTRAIPILFMTGFDDPEHVVQAFSAGGVDFITKPINLDELFARINVHLGLMRRHRSAQLALEATGRGILSLQRNGTLLWRTRQAADLLARGGLPCEEGARMPFTVVDWLAAEADIAGLTLNRAHPIELRRLESDDDHFLVRVVDKAGGSETERLAAAFELTNREADVLRWIASGKSNKEIGDILQMSHRTVNKHLEQVFAKLGVENRTAAATTAVRILWAQDG